MLLPRKPFEATKENKKQEAGKRRERPETGTAFGESVQVKRLGSLRTDSRRLVQQAHVCSLDDLASHALSSVQMSASASLPAELSTSQTGVGSALSCPSLDLPPQVVPMLRRIGWGVRRQMCEDCGERKCLYVYVCVYVCVYACVNREETCEGVFAQITAKAHLCVLLSASHPRKGAQVGNRLHRKS